MKRKTLQQYYVFMVVLLLSNCASYQTNIKSTDYKNEIIRETLLNIERNQLDSEHFATRGHNQFASYLGSLLMLSALFSGITAIIEGL